MNSRKVQRVLVFSITGLILLMLLSNGSREKRQLRSIERRADLIREVSEGSSVSSRTLAGIVYAERRNNVDFVDLYDTFRARLGYDSSVGYCQIKVSTAMWMGSCQGRDSCMDVSRLEYVLQVLNNDRSSLELAAEYVGYIQARYEEEFGVFPSQAVLASYYSRGMDYGKQFIGSDYINELGVRAAEYYNSELHRTLFPE